MGRISRRGGGNLRHLGGLGVGEPGDATQLRQLRLARVVRVEGRVDLERL